jgi:hypothetical protein
VATRRHSIRFAMRGILLWGMIVELGFSMAFCLYRLLARAEFEAPGVYVYRFYHGAGFLTGLLVLMILWRVKDLRHRV